MLVTLKEILMFANKKKCAIGAFNGYNYETFKGIVNASQKMGVPVILAFGAKYLMNMTLTEVASMALTLAKEATIPVCFHLDHCNNPDVVFAAIQAGFTSVMYDGSSHPFTENLEITKNICHVAHACGVSVEAELGCIGAGKFSCEGMDGERLAYTDTSTVQLFVDTTHVDALAVSIGTVHGIYQRIPCLRLDILDKIHLLTKVPLVLHGGSGLSQENIQACIDKGIRKVNINTEISKYVMEKTKDLLHEREIHFSELSLEQINYVEAIVSKYIAYLYRRDY
jgi:fructose-bisphosphate aldolase class II